MLFDLRGRGRRRAVKVIYIGLALLMGVGLIGFGIGGGFGGGGLLTAASNNEGSGSASFASQIKKYRKLTQQQPHNLAAWEGLTKALLHEAGGEVYVTNTGTVTTKGRALFKEAAQAWASYLALNPRKPNAELAQLMETVYGEGGLNEPAKEVEILQIAVAARPTDAALYAALAEYAFKAKNTRVGDLAAAKAVALAPAAQRARVKQELAEVRKNPSGEKTYTTTTNGKTYTGKLNSKGELKGTEVQTATTSTGTTSTAKK
jgi:predicted Zn-dependent protease